MTTDTLRYDDNGQLIKRDKYASGGGSPIETTEYQWSDAGFLTKVILSNGEPVSYYYDGDNRLVGRESSEGYYEFVQSGWDIVEETDETGRRTYFTGLSSVKEESNDGTEYFHYNHRGDTVLKTDKDGNVLWDMSYEAYGKPTDSTGIPANEISPGEFPFLYNAEFGIRYDRKTKLHYMRNRWYSEEQMRFISSDLLMDLNRYGYVSGDPISYTDSFGLQESITPGDKDTVSYYRKKFGLELPGGWLVWKKFGQLDILGNFENFDKMTSKCFRDALQCWADCVEKYEPTERIARGISKVIKSNQFSPFIRGFGRAIVAYGAPIPKFVPAKGGQPITSFTRIFFKKSATANKIIGGPLAEFGKKFIFPHRSWLKKYIGNYAVASARKDAIKHVGSLSQFLFAVYGTALAYVEVSCAAFCLGFHYGAGDTCKK